MSTNKQHINDELLSKFLLDEVTSSEKQDVIAWLQEDENHQAQFDALEQIWLESAPLDPKPIAVDSHIAWQSLQSKIDKHEQIETSAPKISMFAHRQVWAIAASVILVASFVFILTYQPTEQHIILANAESEILLDTLPDGSQITLSQGSQLAYAESFNDNSRNVKLQGKAFFDIERDTTKAFIIDAGIGGVQVLGTSFNVEIEKDSDIVVDVISGTVRLFLPIENNDTLVLILVAGESGIISFENKNITKIRTEPASMYWLNKSLTFENQTLDYVIRVIEELYQIELIPDKNILLSDSINVQFEDANLEEVLEVVTFTYGLSYEKVDSTTFIIKELQDE